MYSDGAYTGNMAVFQLPHCYPDSGTFAERKAQRTEFFQKYLYQNKLKECTACSGYSYYCGHPCGSCEGTGKERER